MRNRFRQRQAAWQPHLNSSRQFILAAAKRCPDRNKVVILGSGLLLDVPLHELSSQFREVILMDVICLPETRKQISSCPNAVFVEHDLTGLSEQLYRHKLQGRADLPGIEAAAPAHCGNADLVVSLNILSQLWVIPRGYAIDRPPRADPEQLDDWCSGMVAAHYSFLRGLPCPVCLIADHAFVKRDREDRVISSGSSVYDLALPEPDASWKWNIAPLGSESGFYSKELRVGAWRNISTVLRNGA
ncbi:MAG: hypothetical protein A2010_05730 [Nitrospirae bacterium GWD2_57_9]|nr:MAG: hypothetical protein A2010_05730 [Nitrospirae bacterium GWD2_57_9]